MPANIETNGDQAAFVSQTLTAWHHLGTVVPPEQELYGLEALKLAHMTDWNVRTIPLVGDLGNGLYLPAPKKFMVVRDSPWVDGQIDYLGTVGGVFQPFQNERSVEVLDAIVDESKGRVETAGSLGNGERTFVCIKLPQEMTIGGRDKVQLFITVTNAHDGTGKFIVVVSPVRVVCNNTLQAALRGAKSRFELKHTTNGEDKIQTAREALGLTWKYVEAFEAEAQKMIEASLTDQAFEDIVRDLYPEPEKEGNGRTLWSEKFDSIWDVWQNDETQEGIENTRWGGYQAITRYLDHVAPVAGQKSREDDGWVAVARAERTATDKRWENYKNEAFAAFAV